MTAIPLLHYQSTGQGPPLVLLHGLGGSCADWTAQLPALATQYQVLTVDLRGHGRSAKPPGPYRIEDMARDVADLLKTLDLPTVHLLGLSLGAMVALQLALDNPERVASLIIVNAEPAYPLRTLRQRLPFYLRLFLIHALGLRRLAQVLSRRLLPGPEHRTLRAELVERFAGNDQAAYLASLNAIAGWSVVERLRELRCPTLVLTAEHDYSSTLSKAAYCAQIRHARLQIINGAHHALPMEKPAAFNAAVLFFLAEQTQSLRGGLG